MLSIMDYAVYRNRLGRLQAMPLRNTWDDDQIHRALQDRERFYLSPIQWERVADMPSAEAAIDVVFRTLQSRDEFQIELKKVPPSERAEAARKILLDGKPVYREDRLAHAPSGWHPEIAREYRIQDFGRRAW